MTYSKHFTHADDVVVCVQRAAPGPADPLTDAKFAGFVSVAAVTVYEQALKHIFIDFARKKHNAMGCYVESQFRRINGRINYRTIKDDYVPNFGSRYQSKFNKKIRFRTNEYLRIHGRDIKTSYNNIIIWRNSFAHEGSTVIPATLTEVIQAYEDGKEVIGCLAETMVR